MLNVKCVSRLKWLFFKCFFLHRALWYNHTKNQRNAKFSKLYWISVVSYMFRTSCVHPQGQIYICGMVCFTCIRVNILVIRWVCSRNLAHTHTHTRTHSSTHQTAHTDACKHTILHIQLSPWGWTHEVRKVQRQQKLKLISKCVLSLVFRYYFGALVDCMANISRRLFYQNTPMKYRP